MHDLLKRVNENSTGIFKRDSELIVILPETIAKIIGDNQIYLSEFIIAKVKGLIKSLNSHPEITDKIFEKLPESICKPFKIYKDDRIGDRDKFIFIKLDPAHQIMIEVHRLETGKTEINTVVPLTIRKRKQLEKNLKAVFSS